MDSPDTTAELTKVLREDLNCCLLKKSICRERRPIFIGVGWLPEPSVEQRRKKIPGESRMFEQRK